MKKIRFLALALATAALALSFAGCGYPQKGDAIYGKWAYNHEPGKVAFKVNATEHKAVLDGKHYDCDVNSEFVTLTDKKGNSMNLRYVLDGEEILLYKIQEYTFEGTPLEGSLAGMWTGRDGKWSFEFTEDGEFKEDGYFPGYYLEDKEAGTITLMYNDHFQDTTLYYTISADKLIVEYPWRMVRPQKLWIQWETH